MNWKILNKHILSYIKKNCNFLCSQSPLSTEEQTQVWQWNISLFFYIGVWFYKTESETWIRCGLSTSNRENTFKYSI